jgi:rubrerythrin
MSDILVRYLKDQFLSEVDAILSYLCHSARVDDREISSALEAFSREEMEHARQIAAHLDRIGEKPEFLTPNVNLDQDLETFLDAGRLEEQDALNRYSLILGLVDEDRARELYDSILKQEQEHLDALGDLLKRVREKREGSGA